MNMPDKDHPIWRFGAIAMMFLAAFMVNYFLAVEFSKDDWLRIINQWAGILMIEGGLKGAKSMFASEKKDEG